MIRYYASVRTSTRDLTSFQGLFSELSSQPMDEMYTMAAGLVDKNNLIKDKLRRIDKKTDEV